MAITRKRKSLEQGDARTCKRTKYMTPPICEDQNPPQTPQANKKRIIIRLITPSAPRKIRLRIPIPNMAKPKCVLTPYPSPPLESDSDSDLERGVSSGVGRDLVGDIEEGEEEEEGSVKRDVNQLLDLYLLADGFRKEGLKLEIEEKLRKGQWMGRVERGNLRRCFGELGVGDGVRRWVVEGLVGVWTGGEGLGFGFGGEEDWGWVGEGVRGEVLRRLREGEL
ncbi:hypothetical protein BKA64DRAFT_741318 [Cadophora sp. MPI-SDFR-AT-0126]|nr:hypothetical protein BKA64DRAFT_741318 [Leotiomycetes sp. MPI-SDFR-AT-0126]